MVEASDARYSNRFWTLLYYWSPCLCITSVHRYSQPTISISRPFDAVVIIGVLYEDY